MNKFFECLDFLKTLSIGCGIVIVLCYFISSCTDNLNQTNRLKNENIARCIESGGSIIPQTASTSDFICIKNK